MGRKRKSQRNSDYYSELAKKKYAKSTSEDSTRAFLNADKRVCSSLGKCETLVVAGECLLCYLRRGLNLR